MMGVIQIRPILLAVQFINPTTTAISSTSLSMNEMFIAAFRP